MREQALLFTGCLSSQFFNLLPFPKQSQSGYLWYCTTHSAVLVLLYHSLCSTCVTYGTPCHSRGAEDFPRRVKYPKDVSLPTFLGYLKPV